ncbi:MAG: rhomboid family intramembrane serine protease [Sphingobacteriales bacterium]|nr:MAG: rhomboid family intramembrane serine protease [Sphingobacteriales bacterium]
MKTVFRRSSSYAIPGYSRNAVLQLIVASGIGFVTYHLIRIIMLVADASPMVFHNNFTANLGLPPTGLLGYKVWTVLTYGWSHAGFWELFSNMIWLYCFGSVVQMLIGYKQIIPLFIYALTVGGVFYLLSQLIPGIPGTTTYVFGAQAAVTAMAVAALTVAPNYRMYFTPTFSIPLTVVAIVFFALMVLNSNLEVSKIALLVGGAATGFGYIRLTQNGYRPGGWMYDIFERLDTMVVPDEHKVRAGQNKKRSQVLNRMPEPKTSNTQKRIDDILEKIHQHGMNSLTKEERDILNKAGNEGH